MFSPALRLSNPWDWTTIGLPQIPHGIFSGLSGFAYLSLGGNRIDPLPLPVSLQKVGDSQFKAVSPTGAPFALNLPVTVSAAGEIDGPASTVSIPAGAVESTPAGVTRVAGTAEAVTVDFAELPVLPRSHDGYTLEKDETLPRVILPDSKVSPPSQVTGVELTLDVELLEVSWTAVSDANGYKVEWKSGEQDYDEVRQVVLTGGDTVSYSLTDLIAGTEYTVRVIATKDHAGDGPPSDEVTATLRASPPAQVTDIEVTPGLELLEATWTAVAGAGGYKVQWKSGTQDYDEARQVVLTGNDTVNYTIIDLTADTEYTVRVIATKDNADDGVPSEEVTATPASANPDINGDGVFDGDDALVMYQAWSAADQVGDGETGGTASSRQTLLAGYAGKNNPSDDDLKKMIRKANVWREVGVDKGGDINEDGEINESDALVMIYAYTLEDLVGNGRTGGTARFRQLLLASHSNKANPSDEELKAMLRRANKLRDDFG